MNKLKKYSVTLKVEKTMTATVKARNEKEANKKALVWENLIGEQTEFEDIVSVLDSYEL
jgi:hypothetical protein